MPSLGAILRRMFSGRRADDSGPQVDHVIVHRTTYVTAQALERNSLLRAELSALETRLRDRVGGGKVRSDGVAR